MPRPNLKVDWAQCEAETVRLRSLLPSLVTLSPAHRKLVAEIVMVRLFLLIENTIASSAAKMLCGAAYLDATLPMRLVTPQSMEAAKTLMRTHGRNPAKRNLWWTQSREIRDNLCFTLNAKDPFFGIVSRHAGLLTDMRHVRNHIAHKNASTRANFQNVVRRHCGGLKRGMTPGLLLLITLPSGTSLLESYIVSGRVTVRDLLHA